MSGSSRSISRDRDPRRRKLNEDAENKLLLLQQKPDLAVQTGNDLSQKINKFVTKSMPGTFACSGPLVRWLVGMAELGAADGQTRNEIRKAIQLDLQEPQDNFIKSQSRIWNDIQGSLSGTRSMLVQSARLVVPLGYALDPSFTQALTSLNSTEVLWVDLSDLSNPAEVINSIMANDLQNHITNFLQPNVLNRETRLLLVGCAYFRGEWEEPFDPKLTRKVTFHLTNMSGGKVERTVLVNMMQRKMNLFYVELPDLHAHAISIPYKGSRLELLLVKLKDPQDPVAFARLRESLPHSALLSKLVNKSNVSVQLPRFVIQASTHLIPVLQSLGIRTPFSPLAADFSSLISTHSDSALFISDIIQTVRFQINETATDDGLTTQPEVGSSGKSPGGNYGSRSSPSRRDPPVAVNSASMTGRKVGKKAPKLLHFYANQPFIFQLVDRPTGLILFIGTCTNPTLQCSLC